MFHHLGDSQPLIDVPVQHLSDQIDAILGKREKWDSKRVVQDLVDVVEGILFIYDRIQKYAKGPHILLFASVGFALKDLRGGVICQDQYPVMSFQRTC